jgi:uncharacterized protein (TIGR00369 family)
MTPEQRKLVKDFVSRSDAFNLCNGLELTEVGEGTATIEVELAPHNLNSWNTPHGGLLFAMADVACGVAAVSVRMEKCVTASASIDYIAAAGSTGRLRAEARVLRAGGRLAFCTAEVRDEKGTLLNRLNTTMYYCGVKLD